MNANHTAAGKLMQASRVAVQAGLTLIELMIAIVLGMLVVLAAIALLLSTKTTYTHQDDATRLEDTGRYALEIVTRALHQTAYENWGSEGAPIVAGADFRPNIQGYDAKWLKDDPDISDIDNPQDNSVNGSDVLAVRYFGSGSDAKGDGTVVNCAGNSVKTPSDTDDVDTMRGWSIFYVAVSSTTGEPELYCKYRGTSGWTAASIATGVESFQVLYGVDIDGDGVPNTYLNADGVDAMDASLVLAGATPEEKKKDRWRKTYWKKITEVKIGLLLRAASMVSPSTATVQYDLFSEEYGTKHGGADQGTRIMVAELAKSAPNRLRKVFQQTIQLRNRTAGGGA
jgi:type IV pilus assembly protein PilW